MKITPAQMRDHARDHIQHFDGMDRPMRAFIFLEHMVTNPEFFYTTAQIKAAAEGLRAGMEDR
jgi:hypothetical protein